MTEIKENEQGENKRFIFLYPQEEIFNYELEFGSHIVDKKWWAKRKSYFKPQFDNAETEEQKKQLQAEARKDRVDFFRPIHNALLNRCISERYRMKGFQIVYALLDNEPLSSVIEKKPEDRIIFVGIDAKTHRTRGSDGNYPYPNQDYILDQIMPLSQLVIGGFHMWDCVEKLAKAAYARKISVLVDEDLTQFFSSRMTQRGFRSNVYPSYNPKALGKNMFRDFMKARVGKPWLWQEY